LVAEPVAELIISVITTTIIATGRATRNPAKMNGAVPG